MEPTVDIVGLRWSNCRVVERRGETEDVWETEGEVFVFTAAKSLIPFPGLGSFDAATGTSKEVSVFVCVQLGFLRLPTAVFTHRVSFK
ncbi:unnamed protein product [Schistocephalus solidus]|uniref:Uncharacterized protein n=1 Tax=Schistocephalus solidus TaxID=70667 RepID=A0A183STL5_SCHSO|nr:unnamed protein product [Schistocephalus solidus]